MLEFLQSGQALSVLAAIGMIGILSKFVTRSLYRRLLKETDNMAMTKNKNLRVLKQKLENIYRLNQNIVNTQAYLDKQMYSFKFLRVSLDGWNNISTQMMILLLMVGGIGSFLSYWYGLDSYYIVLYASMGALGSLFLAFVDSSFNIGRKQQRLETALVEYMDNSAFVRAARENSGRELAARDAADMVSSPRAVQDVMEEREKIARENEIRNGLVREEPPRLAGRAARSRNSRAEELLRTVRSMKAEDGRADTAGSEKGTRIERPDFRKSEDFSGETEGKERKESRRKAEYRVKERGLTSEADSARQEESEVRRDINYLKQSLEQIAASKERDGAAERARPGNLKEEELKIIGEFMKEYFSY